MNRVHRTLSLIALFTLSACGGGGNESGPPDQVYLSVASVSVGSTGNCVAMRGPEIHVYGGTPPYKLANSVPQGMTLNKTVLQNSGDGFVITFTGMCLDTMPITVEDQAGLLAQVSVSNGK
ncbi:hypothetical protein ACG02S_01750 [Roseateles sp. DC23W]|uniref:Lipoprotein n=1 Tax=Pelomonas dachongensis TaxID=3299029 RepID=A0ABW7EGN3_9BURK